jgi:hypothetical protein
MEELCMFQGTIRIKDGHIDYTIVDRPANDSYKSIALSAAKVNREIVLEAVNNFFDKIEKGEAIHEKYTEEELEALSRMALGMAPYRRLT